MDMRRDRSKILSVRLSSQELYALSHLKEMFPEARASDIVRAAMLFLHSNIVQLPADQERRYAQLMGGYLKVVFTEGK